MFTIRLFVWVVYVYYPEALFLGILYCLSGHVLVVRIFFFFGFFFLLLSVTQTLLRWELFVSPACPALFVYFIVRTYCICMCSVTVRIPAFVYV